MKKLLIPVLLLNLSSSFAQYDVCVYGGTSAGVIAAYTAAKLNKKVLLIEPGSHLGGMCSGGLGNTDIGIKCAITGLSEDFYRRIGKYYNAFEQWIFEPHAAEAIFNQYIKEANVQVLYKYQIDSVTKTNGYIQSITLQSVDSLNVDSSFVTQNVTALMFIDCSYEGDLMALAKVSYTIGRESSSQYNESLNGVRTPVSSFSGVNPYQVSGKSSSGLLWGISNTHLGTLGSADGKIQAYNYRICLTKNLPDKIEITRPANYDSTKYRLLARLVSAQKITKLSSILKIDAMPNSKSDINNAGSFSTDMIGANYTYPDGNYDLRKQIKQAHVDYTKGLIYFIGHDSTMPDTLKKQMLVWGYPKDEYTDNNNWSPQLYIREGRRMISSYIMTQANCTGNTFVNDGIGMASYTIDCHNAERLIISTNNVRNEGQVSLTLNHPYFISYRSIIPNDSECKNLYVPVCISASHIAYASLRMEPVFMELGESAAAAACMAIDSNESVQNVNVQQLQTLLATNPLMNGSVPEVVVSIGDTLHTSCTGNWIKTTTNAYDSIWLHTSTRPDTQKVIFKPYLPASCAYTVYTYVCYVDSAASKTHYTVNNGITSKSLWIKDSVKASGQSYGKWLSLGTFALQAGNQTTVTIDASNTTGAVNADSILFIPAGTCTINKNLYTKR